MDALTLFGLSNPEAAALLAGCDRTPGLELCTTQLNEPNLHDTRSTPSKYVYDQTGALNVAFSWRQQFSLYKIDFLVVFGVGLGYEWQALKPWLDSDPEKSVVFVEDDLSMLHHFLQQPHAREILLHPKTRVFYIDADGICRQVAELIAWNQFGKKQLFAPTAYYQATRPKSSKKVEQKLKLFWNEIDCALDELRTFGSLQFRNFFKNISSFRKARFGSDLFHSFKGMPAIVVAAGPSLEGCFDELRLLQDSALIISGGTATNALLEEGIRPHFCAAIDPNPSQYNRLKQIQPFGIPMFYRSRVLPEGISTYEGELLYLRGGDGQPLIEWMDTALGFNGPLIDGGHSVSNAIIEIAHHLGCNPIILVGYDLSYPQGRMYPDSVREALSSKEQEELAKTQTGSVQTVGNDGAEVSTEEKWIVEASWILKRTELYPRTQLINASVQGLRLGHIPCMPFHEVYETYGNKTYSVQAKVHTEVMKARSLPFSQEKLFVTLQKIADSVQSCMELLPKVQAQDHLAVEQWHNEFVYKHFLETYGTMFDKKKEMERLYCEVEWAHDREALNRFEKRSQEEKLQFFSHGLPLLAKWIREYSATAIYEGFMPPESVHLYTLDESVFVPEYLL